MVISIRNPKAEELAREVITESGENTRPLESLNLDVIQITLLHPPLIQGGRGGLLWGAQAIVNHRRTGQTYIKMVRQC